jgi:hypothetical protein
MRRKPSNAFHNFVQVASADVVGDCPDREGQHVSDPK